MLALQLYRKSREETSSLPFWRFVAAADHGEEGWKLLDAEAARWRRKNHRTKIVSMPLGDAAHEIHQDKFRLIMECTQWESRSPDTGLYRNEWGE